MEVEKKYDGETLDHMTLLDAKNAAYDDFTPEACEDTGDRYGTTDDSSAAVLPERISGVRWMKI